MMGLSQVRVVAACGYGQEGCVSVGQPAPHHRDVHPLGFLRERIS